MSRVMMSRAGWAGSLRAVQALRPLQAVRAMPKSGAPSFSLARAYATPSGSVTDAIRVERFWEQISVEDTGSSRQVCLAGKPMKTPDGRVLEIPLSKPAVLAELIRQEWQVLPSLKLKSHMVPLTSLAGRSLDIQPEDRAQATDKLLPYLDTDTLVVLSPSKDCNGELREAQKTFYPQLVEEAKQLWGLPADGIKVLDTETSLYGNYQPEETKQKVREWIDSLDSWQFASLERATTAAKSLILAALLVLQRRPVSELAMLASLDVIHQTALWGEVEDTHDVDRADLHRLLGAAYINALNSPRP